ncbi:hypothetical protein ACIRPK_00995 [Kitasatospora sp. NPDC101801]|uniref:hypothetical protein n=1 Tax=Kitasatospora sp. NPDC101801 TaxID=3364103 RepID=UPI00381E450B
MPQPSFAMQPFPPRPISTVAETPRPPVPPTPSAVSFDAARSLAVLRTPNSTYALRVGADGSPRHLH